MANDPNRDYLPVREYSNRSTRGSNERFDHQILNKLPRCELEDRVHRLLDEKTHLKKLVNTQDEKIKRLGTKLLRIISEKKNGKRFSGSSKESEELQIRIIELEHENYALKDKNTVLKQQLASHSRGVTHRSPARSNHQYSVLMSTRQGSGPLQSEVGFDSSPKHEVAEAQLQAAQAHIQELNEEIRSLHTKIDHLQQNLERSSLDNRKTKVAENIELIRLQRSLKQQAIQISALQAQVKNSENNQQMLKDELLKAHNENEEALQLISVKQNEILNLCNKLEESNLSRQEDVEFKERIKDLAKERDYLRERCDQLLGKIGEKQEEIQEVECLRKRLSQEKEKNESLEKTIDNLQKQLSSKPTVESPCKSKTNNDSASKLIIKESKFETFKVESEKKIKDLTVEEPMDNRNTNDNILENMDNYYSYGTNPKTSNVDEPRSDYSQTNNSIAGRLAEPSKLTRPSRATTFMPVEGDDKKSEVEKEFKDCLCRKSEDRYFMDKMKLEQELHYLREMLRSQTSRCEAQQTEISRLMYELRLNEDKCNDTLKKLDLHLKIFQHFEAKTKDTVPVESLFEEKGKKEKEDREKEKEREKERDRERERERLKGQMDNTASKPSSREDLKYNARTSRPMSTYDSTDTDIDSRYSDIKTKKDFNKESSADNDNKKRFVDQVFLESSDEETNIDKSYDRNSFIKKLGELGPAQRRDVPDSTFDTYELNPVNTQLRTSSDAFLSDMSIPPNSSAKKDESHVVKATDAGTKPNPTVLQTQTPTSNSNLLPYVQITIHWLQCDLSKSIWKDDKIKLIFIDFSFLDVKGEETETPESLPTPKKSNDLCIFNFTKKIEMNESKKRILISLLNKTELTIIVFKCVSDPEDNTDECEDFGVADVTVREFLDKNGKGSFSIPVKNANNPKETIGKLSISVQASPELFKAVTF